MASAARINVAIIGVGGVGSEVISQLTTVANLSKSIAIVALQNSKKTLLLDPAAASGSSLSSDWKAQLASSSTAALSLADLTAYLSRLQQHTVVVDNTSNDDVASFYPRFLQAGLSVVTPNKKAFSSSLTLYKQIYQAAASGAAGKPTPLVYGESTVGAGLPILSTLKDLIETGDEVTKIEGVLSGTLSYIFNQWSTPQGSSKKFSEIVKIAKDNGYTEPHPGDDLSGSDVSRKLTILSRLIPALTDSLPDGYQSVPTHSLTPAPLADVKDPQEYIDKLPQYDGDFDALNKEAQDKGAVLRYVGVIDVQKKEIKASLEQYPADHAFATSLAGSDNIISFTTKRYGARPLLIQGAGAGGPQTAMGVVSDLIKIAERRATPDASA